MHALWEWLKWEFDRRIEVTQGIRLIMIERFLKAAILVLGGILLIAVSARGDLHRLAQDVQTELNLDPGRSWWEQLYEKIVLRFGNLSTGKEVAVAVGAILYGLLEALEGAGLLLG